MTHDLIIRDMHISQLQMLDHKINVRNEMKTKEKKNERAESG